VETDSHGDFEAPHLRAGAYRVEDASPGFSAFRREGLVLRAGETLRVDLSLVSARARRGGAGRRCGGHPGPRWWCGRPARA
jgi:hypothetical protein